MPQQKKLQTQQQIFNIISKEPGLNISTIANLFHLPVPHVLYHLRYLEKHDLITMVKEKGFTRCYVKGTVGVKDKKLLSILRQDICLKIILFLLHHPYSRHHQILDHFTLAKSTLTYHLQKLIKHEIIGIQDFGSDQAYYVLNEKRILHCLMKYKPSRIATGMEETWANFTVYKNSTK